MVHSADCNFYMTGFQCRTYRKGVSSNIRNIRNIRNIPDG